NITALIFSYILNYITTNTFKIIVFAIIKYMKSCAVIHIQSVPGSYPQYIICIFEKLVDRAVGKTVTVIVMLNKKWINRNRFCLQAKEKQKTKSIKKVKDPSH